MAKMANYTVYFQRGFGGPINVMAESEHDAKLMGLAEFRRNYGSYDMVDNRDVGTIVKCAVEAKPKA